MCKPSKPKTPKAPPPPDFLRNPLLDGGRGNRAFTDSRRNGRSSLRIALGGNGLGIGTQAPLAGSMVAAPQTVQSNGGLFGDALAGLGTKLNVSKFNRQISLGL